MQIIIKNRDNCGKCSSKICRYGSKTGKKSVDMGLRPGKNMGGWVGFLFSGLHTPVTFLDKYPPGLTLLPINLSDEIMMSGIQ